MSTEDPPAFPPVRIVCAGVWLYDGLVDKPVDIVALEYDFWYEIGRADGQLEPDEMPQRLGPDGCLYYVRFVHAGELGPRTWVDGMAHETVDEAKEAAQAKAPAPIRWAEPLVKEGA